MEYTKQCTGTAKAFIDAFGASDAHKYIQEYIDTLRIFHESETAPIEFKLNLAFQVDFWEQTKASIDQVTKTIPRSFFEGLNPNN